LLDECLMFDPTAVQLCRLKAFAACWVGGTILAEGLCDWEGSAGHAPSFNYTLAFCLTTEGNQEKHQSGYFKSIQHMSIISC